MRILLVQQETGRRKNEKAIFPLGLACLASVLAGKHCVEIFDPNIYPIPQSLQRLKAALEEFKPEVVGMSIRYIDTTQRRDPFIYYRNVKPAVEIIKKIDSGIKIIVGGAGFSIFAKEIMRDIPHVDFGAYLEAEDSFSELLNNLDDPGSVRGIFFRENGNVRFTGDRVMPDFANLPGVAASAGIIDISKYITSDYRIFGIQTKRGCAHECIYCSYPFLNGTRVRLKDPAKVVDEIEIMVKKYGLKAFSFADNIFNVPIDHAEAICRDIVRRNLSVEWGAWYDVRNFSDELLSLAARAGCRYIEFSPDAATDEGLGFLRKGITVADIHKSIDLVKKKKDVTVSYNFFCSHPAQDVRGLIATLCFYCKILFRLFGRARVGLGWIRILPNTFIRHIAIKEKIISEESNLLVTDEASLKKIFYVQPALRYLDMLCVYLLTAAEWVAKPVLKYTFKLLGKNYPFYYG